MSKLKQSWQSVLNPYKVDTVSGLVRLGFSV